MTGAVSRYLEDDHIRIDEALQRAASSAEGVEPTAYAEFRGALLRHIGMEEKILLPAAQQYGAILIAAVACSAVAIVVARRLSRSFLFAGTLCPPTPPGGATQP